MKRITFLSAITAMAVIAFSQSVKAQSTTDDYTLVFADEFDQPDGSQPDSDKWQRSRRYSSTWNRWISNSEEVAYIEDGCLVLKAIPNNDKETDTADMLTGAVETRDKFSFTYGKVDIRMQVEPFKGSFPAAWMMPQPPADSWPKGGEIDIFESIDAANTAYHTIHTNWTYTLGNRNNPKSSFSEYCNISQWHVYSLEWTEDQLTWSVDGNVKGIYKKSTNQSHLEQGQWPFDHDFYIIVNQSVGDGSWAAKAQTDHTYISRVDYVRVYQKKPSAIEEITNDKQTQQASNNTTCYDLQGRKLTTQNAQQHSNISIINNKKIIRKR